MNNFIIAQFTRRKDVDDVYIFVFIYHIHNQIHSYELKNHISKIILKVGVMDKRKIGKFLFTNMLAKRSNFNRRLNMKYLYKILNLRVKIIINKYIL